MEITARTRTAGKEQYYVYINVHDGGKHPVERQSTGIKINKKQWNKTGSIKKRDWVRTTHSHYPSLNKRIFDMITRLEAKHKGLSTDKVIEEKERAITGGRKSFIRYAETFIANRRKATTQASDTYGVNKLKQYLEENDNAGLQFKEINKQFVKDYYNWLLGKVKVSSANQYLNTLQTVFNAGVEDETVNIKVNQDPFKIKREKAVRRNRGLKLDEVARFKDMVIPDNKPKWLEAKHMFLFQFSTGVRVRDMLYMRWEDIRENSTGIQWESFSTKTRKGFVKQLPLKIQLLLLPSLEQYYPGIQEELKPLLKNDTHNLAQKELSQSEILELIDSGMSLEQIKEKLQPQENPHLELQQLLQSRIIDLSFDKPKMFVFGYGNRMGFNMDTSDKKEKAKIAQATSSYDRFLKEPLRKLGKIRSNISSHVARHTATQMLLESGANHMEVSKWLGHSREGTTAEYAGRLGVQRSTLESTLSDLL